MAFNTAALSLVAMAMTFGWLYAYMQFVKFSEPDLTRPPSGPVWQLMQNGYTRRAAELYVQGWRPGPDLRGFPSWDPVHLVRA